MSATCRLSSSYLSEDDVLDQSNPFVQLVSGVVWLLRNGEVYINQSLTAECDKTQETGGYRPLITSCQPAGSRGLIPFSRAIKGFFRTFVDVTSARTAVGHDADGRLILFQIDGQTGQRG